MNPLNPMEANWMVINKSCPFCAEQLDDDRFYMPKGARWAMERRIKAGFTKCPFCSAMFATIDHPGCCVEVVDQPRLSRIYFSVSGSRRFFWSSSCFNCVNMSRAVCLECNGFCGDKEMNSSKLKSKLAAMKAEYEKENSRVGKILAKQMVGDVA